MKQLIFLIVTAATALVTDAQNVGIGTPSPHSSARVDIVSSNSGILIPRLGAGQRNAITSPAKGLMLYDTSLSAFYYHDGGKWRPVYEKNYDSSTINYFDISGPALDMPSATNGSASLISDNVNNGFIYDNGGAAGNYSANIYSGFVIQFDDSTTAIKIAVQEMAAEISFDSLHIVNLITNDTLASYTGNQTGEITAYESVLIVFKANGTNQLAGFKIRWGRLRISGDIQSPPPLYGWHFIDSKLAAMGGLQQNNYWHINNVGYGSFSYGIGNRAYGKGAVAMGYNTTAGEGATAIGNSTVATGINSVALGFSSGAPGNNAVAFGSHAIANGFNAIAFGNSTTASGDYATAFGSNTTASGDNATAFGVNAIASDLSAIAMGSNVTASGSWSVAMGRRVSTNLKIGTFFFGDSDPFNKGVRLSSSDNEFVCRFNNGYYFITSNSGASDIGVRVVGGGNAWSSISDKYRKENFVLTNGEEVLQKLRAIPLGSWNYIGQDPATFRHYGIMAQDFYAAFGKDPIGVIGSDTLVNPIDMMGISFSAIQALEKRTQKIEELERENAALKKQGFELKDAYAKAIVLLYELQEQVSLLKKLKQP